MTYTTTGADSFPNPDVYPSRRHSWVHIFPEGMIHQHPDKVMRYFKWGVARLILESEPCPDVVPMWIDGPQHVMDDKRPWPRPLPRAGRDISVNFGETVNEEVWRGFRERWRRLKERAAASRAEDWEKHSRGSAVAATTAAGAVDAAWRAKDELGVLTDWDLKFGEEAEKLRVEVTLAVRNEVLKVRRATGLADEDPKRSLAETFRAEGGKEKADQREKADDSIVRDG